MLEKEVLNCGNAFGSVTGSAVLIIKVVKARLQPDTESKKLELTMCLPVGGQWFRFDGSYVKMAEAWSTRNRTQRVKVLEKKSFIESLLFSGTLHYRN